MQKHVNMINSPDEWPRWPLLPVKNPGRYNTPPRTADHGIILAYERHFNKNFITVFHCNMFAVPTKMVKNSANDGEHSAVDFEKLEALGYETYRDAEAIVDGGWVVD